MAEKCTKPEIRFKGFDGEWERKKLGEVAPLRGGFGFKSNNFINEGIPIVKISNILSSGNVGGNFDYYSEIDNDEKLILPNKAALLAMSGATTGKVSILLNYTNSKFYQNQRVGYFTQNEIVDYSFISTLVRSEHFTKQLNAVLVAGAQPNVSSKEIDNFDFNVPAENKEQSQIGTFFQSLDTLISLRQKKLDKLTQVKKSMLEKMFPKDGADEPEIRFKGFTGKWERKKLGQVTERIRGNDGRMNLPTLTISAGNGWLDQRDRFYGNIAGKEQKNYTLLSKGELSYNHGNSKLAKYGTVFVLTTYEEALVPRVYHSFKVNSQADAGFIEYLFATKLPDKELGKIISSGARMDGLLNISYDDFVQIIIVIPEVLEQCKIRNYFRILDSLISLHQCELDKLKNIKKSCLEKMFV